ncbi:MAG TPA: class I SAM-dependent methyltransferase [Bacteroidia bacterium]|nr:class I SAM-dependent methyltransferase [Bacteroidia bacterium]
MNDSEKIAENRRLWDSRVAGHVASTFYDVPGFLAGACALKAPELLALGDVSGQTMLHLQCHFGLDTLSWARRGAVVTGMDFSGTAIAQARELAVQAGLAATFVESSVYDLPQHLSGQFDIVFVSYGALIWLPDLDRWADVVCQYLKPGGRLCVAEFHPYWYGLNWETCQVEYPYFNSGEAFEETAASSYAGSPQSATLREFFWSHSLGEIIQPLLDRGIQLQHFREYAHSAYNAFPNMVEVRPGEWVPKALGEGKAAIMFTLVGQKKQ